MMIQNPAFVRAGNGKQATVLFGHVVDAYAHRQKVVIGTGIKCPVLMPLHRAAELSGLHIEFTAVAPDSRANQLGYDI